MSTAITFCILMFCNLVTCNILLPLLICNNKYDNTYLQDSDIRKKKCRFRSGLLCSWGQWGTWSPLEMHRMHKTCCQCYLSCLKYSPLHDLHISKKLFLTVYFKDVYTLYKCNYIFETEWFPLSWLHLPWHSPSHRHLYTFKIQVPTHSI